MVMVSCFSKSDPAASKEFSSAPGLKEKIGRGAAFGFREGLRRWAWGDRGGDVECESNGDKIGMGAGKETEVIANKATTQQYRIWCSGQQAGAMKSDEGVPAPC